MIYTLEDSVKVIAIYDKESHIIHSFVSSTNHSSTEWCNTVSKADRLRCRVSLKDRLDYILHLQILSRQRYSLPIQFFWMSSVRIRTRLGGYIIQYLPLFEDRKKVLNRFLEHYNLRSLIETEMGVQPFFAATAEAMNDIARRRVLFITLLLSSTLSSLASWMVISVKNEQKLPVSKGTLSSVLRVHNDFMLSNFGRMRLLLIYLVVISHSIDMTGNHWLDPLNRYLSCDLGTFAAAITHAISGVLAHDAVHRHGSDRFLFRRAIRIWPALFMLGFVSIGILGPILSQTSPLSYALSRSGRRVVWWCISGECLLQFSNAVDDPMSFEVGDTIQTSSTPVAVALWSMPQLCLSWLVLAAMHAVRAVHFSPLFFVGMATLVAVGTSDKIYIAAFFMGAAAASKAEAIVLSSKNMSMILQSFILCALLLTVMSSIDDRNPFSLLLGQLWKALVAVCTYWVFLFCSFNHSTNLPLRVVQPSIRKRGKHVQRPATTKNKRSRTPLQKRTRKKRTRKKSTRCSDYCTGNLVMGTYVFGSGVQSVLVTMINRGTMTFSGGQNGTAVFVNLCLSLPIIFCLSITYSKIVQLIDLYVSTEGTHRSTTRKLHTLKAHNVESRME